MITKVKRFSVESLDLGLADFDPSEAMRRLLALEGASQGFLVEKSQPDESAVFLGTSPFEILRIVKGQALSEAFGRRSVLPGNPFLALGRRLAGFRLEGRAPPFTTGAVGFLGYEMARHLERIPARTPGQEAVLMLFGAIVCCDRLRGRTELFGLVPCGPKAASERAALSRRAQAIASELRGCRPSRKGQLPPGRGKSPGPALGRGVLGREGFMRAARRIKEHIRAGDIFQCVLSESFTLPTEAEPLRIYRCLRRVSPAPYLFFLKDGEEHWIGASPERLVKVLARQALNCPIAGTRPRGGDPRADLLLERALRRSPKERAEHLMLVDLARNDLGRVCAPGTVRVRTLMEVRRFSHVMHLVSEVEGRLERGRASWEAMAASFPAGTVSGAPKVRAMEIIAGLEPQPRGFYAGALLQHDLQGNLDSCISIRAMSVSRGLARLQAGAGIVADSRPEREYDEVRNKLLGLRRALALAQGHSAPGTWRGGQDRNGANQMERRASPP